MLAFICPVCTDKNPVFGKSIVESTIDRQIYSDYNDENIPITLHKCAKSLLER